MTDDTKTIIFRSRVRLFAHSPNLKVDPQDNIDEDHDISMAIFDPESLIGRSYLSIPEEDGSRTCLQIVKLIESLDSDIQQSPEMIKFKAVNH